MNKIWSAMDEGQDKFGGMNRYLRVFTLMLLVSLASTRLSCRAPTPTENEYPSWPTKVPAGKIEFKTDVRPILVVNCLECHNNEDAGANGNLSLETRKLALTTGNHAPVLIPGEPDKSLLLTVLTIDDVHLNAMPPSPDKVYGVRMKILRRWIEEGADWPDEVVLVHPREIESW